jgi:hypothetical protein
MSYLQEYEIDWNTWKAVRAKFVAGSDPTMYYLQNDLQYVPFVVADATSIIEGQALYYVNVNRDPSSVSGPYAALTSGVKASAHIQDIVYTATSYGVSSVTVAYVSDASAVGKEYVTVAGSAITVHIVSGQSTAQQVQAAVNGWNAYTGLSQYNSSASSELVSAVIDTGREGIPQVTAGATPLAGGVAAVTVLSDWETNFKSSATLVTSFSNGVALSVAA